MQGKSLSPNAENARTYRAGLAKRLDQIERKVDALLRATLNNGVVLPADAETELRQAFRPEDPRR